jgi:hypothetical protein
MDILIGIMILALIVGLGYVVTHHKPPTTPSGADLANTVSNAATASWDALKRDLPAIVSAELAQAKADLASAKEYAAGLEQKLAATVAAHNADKAAVAARVAAAVTASPELPPSPVVPAVAAARAEDLAAVRAATAQISA